MKSIKYSDTRYNHGGLMRCCIETIQREVEANPDKETQDEGTVIDCAYEESGNKRIFLSPLGIWGWNRGDK